MFAFVAGATGFTGRSVVDALLARGQHAVAHVRPDSHRLEEWRTRFEALGATVDTTPWENSAMAATMSRLRPGMVFALLGTTRARARRDASRGRDSSYQAIDYGLSRMLLEATRDSGSKARFIYLSSLGVGPNARGTYLAVRWQLEQLVRGSGLDFVIARPAFIAGAQRDDSRPIARLTASLLDAALRTASLVGARALYEQYSSLTGRQLATALVEAALTDEYAGRVLDVASLRRIAGSKE